MIDPLETLRSSFVARCGDDLAGLRRARKNGNVSEIGRLAHRLAGSAGSFGFPEISRRALIVDEACRSSAVVPDAALSELIALLNETTAAGMHR